MEKTKKTFDAVAFMRKAREELSERFKGMTFEEKRRYINEKIGKKLPINPNPR